MSFNLTTEEGLKQANEFLNANNYFSGENMPNQKDIDILNQMKDVPSMKSYPNLFGYYFDFALFQQESRELWTKPQQTNQKKGKKNKKEEKKVEKKEEKKDDDDLDLFGSDDELEKKEQELKEKKKTEKKKVVVFKSRVVMDVKGYEVGQDFETLCNQIKEKITFPDLEWMNDQKILPVGFGMKKLQMVMKIEDTLTTDEIIDKILEVFEDDVQSCDVVDFQKA